MMTIKNLFLDNNVIIGFLYVLDNLNPDSEVIVNSNDDLYYSYHVKQEIEDVTIRKDKEYTRFFSLISSKLRKHKDSDFISLSSFHMFIDNAKPINKLSVENMHYAFNRMWEDFGFGENQLVSEIKLKLNNYIIDFDQKHLSRETYFFETAKYIPAHRHKDQQILDMIISESLEDDLHGEDKEILFDLHEYNSKYPHLDLIFVSWDKTFIKVVKTLIEALSFNQVICLKD